MRALRLRRALVRVSRPARLCADRFALRGVLTLVMLGSVQLPLPGPLARQAWLMRLHDRIGQSLTA